MILIPILLRSLLNITLKSGFWKKDLKMEFYLIFSSLICHHFTGKNNLGLVQQHLSDHTLHSRFFVSNTLYYLDDYLAIFLQMAITIFSYNLSVCTYFQEWFENILENRFANIMLKKKLQNNSWAKFRLRYGMWHF